MGNGFYVIDFALGLLLFISVINRMIIKLRARHLEASVQLRAEFFECANKLVDDEETPDLIVSYVENLADVLNTSHLSRHILKSALTGRLRDSMNKPSVDSEKFISSVRSMRKELRDLVARAAATGILAATYKSLFFGVIVRRMVLFSVERIQEQAEVVASDMVFGGQGHWHAAA